MQPKNQALNKNVIQNFNQLKIILKLIPELHLDYQNSLDVIQTIPGLSTLKVENLPEIS